MDFDDFGSLGRVALRSWASRMVLVYVAPTHRQVVLEAVRSNCEALQHAAADLKVSNLTPLIYETAPFHCPNDVEIPY